MEGQRLLGRFVQTTIPVTGMRFDGIGKETDCGVLCEMNFSLASEWKAALSDH
jgi:hypothetical protein